MEVSLERVDLLDGDVIVQFGSDAEDALAALEDTALWDTLRAVRAGRVHEVDPYYWFQGNVLAAQQIRSDIIELLG